MKIDKPAAIPTTAGSTMTWGGLIGSSNAVVCSELIDVYPGLVLIITDDMQQTSRLQAEIQQFTSAECMVLPDWETLPYDSFSPHQDIISDRLACFHRLTHKQKGALLLPVHTLMQKCCPPSFLTGHVFVMKEGEQLSREALRLQLDNAGYRNTTQVMAHGEYAVRGALLDIFPMGSNIPYRVDFFDDEIDSIRTFDIDTQRTIDKISEISLLPAHEFPFDKKAIELFRSQWRQHFEVRREPESIYQQVSKHILPPGIEYWQPLFFSESLTPFFTYLPPTTLLVTTENVTLAADKYWKSIGQRYESRRVDPLRPLLPPGTLWLNPSELFSDMKAYPKIRLSKESFSEKNSIINHSFEPLPTIAIDPKSKHPFKLFHEFYTNYTGNLILTVESEGRREAVSEMLKSINIHPRQITHLSQMDECERCYIMVGALEQGFIDSSKHRAFITENELAEQRPTRQRQNTKHVINTELLIRSLAELTPGKPVVHLEHGVGRYEGLTTLETGGIDNEYMILRYANNTKLYVPVSSLNLISRYSGGDEETAPLNKLGTDNWTKARHKAVEKIRDVAAELLDIYATRKSKSGFQFHPVEPEYSQFCQSFPYEITADQGQAIEATLNNMYSPAAMDRLVCGDVGFGKTEVAMRAAFVAAMNHKQVAILVPTTLLAQQHYENFCNRFADWPLRIETLSRFKSAKDQQLILKAMQEGKIDILIGTHKLLQNDIKWHDLGLLIVDEEHRFGVKQKERIKAMRANVDILTLTATPIPRTLNMAMSEIRDLSIIATPPARRLAVKTFVREYDALVIREAILREILRGGQVYFLHNDVRSIEKTKQKIKSLIPEARIAVAHGQMNERELERVMNEFQHQKFNVLICTTIIETGIDIPNANTIIIERADKFGLAQLHQLRGRVGRSYHQAYAYLLAPSVKLLTSDAKKRLEAIAALEDLGAGFALAMHDLEIRGAGELLGEEQSGQIATIGFTLYTELLEEAVTALKEGKFPSLDRLFQENQAEIELRLPALIPENFIPDVNTRLSFYKRIASALDHNELQELKIEMIDRYGLLPDPLKALFEIAGFKLTAKYLGITRIELNDKGGFIEFSEKHIVSIDYLIELIQKKPSVYRLENQNRIKLLEKQPSKQARLKFMDKLLEDLKKNSCINSQE